MATVTQNLGLIAFPRNPVFSVGKKIRTVSCALTFPTTGAAGDQYVLAGPLDLEWRVARIQCQAFPALTTATDSNLGFYYLNSAGVLTKVTSTSDVTLWSGVSLATAVTVFTDLLLSKNSSLDTTKSIGQLLSLGPDKALFGGIYLVLTLPTANTAGGTAKLDVYIEEATTR